MYKVALTGGIGSGKTTAAEMFSQYNVPLLDTDQLAREVVKVGQPGLLQLQAHFGKQIIAEDGSLNRAALGDIIFQDERQRKRVQSILHPLIYELLCCHIKLLENQHNPYCLIIIPLLFEEGGLNNKWARLADRILVIDCPEVLQVERVMARDHCSEAKAMAIIASQVSRQFRLSLANDVLNGSMSREQLAMQIEALHNLYLSFSNSKLTACANQD